MLPAKSSMSSMGKCCQFQRNKHGWTMSEFLKSDGISPEQLDAWMASIFDARFFILIFNKIKSKINYKNLKNLSKNVLIFPIILGTTKHWQRILQFQGIFLGGHACPCWSRLQIPDHRCWLGRPEQRQWTLPKFRGFFFI